jgi:DNA-directed RNA polymerase subunit omega
MIGASQPAGGTGGEDVSVEFDRMTEEDLLRGLEGLVPPAETDEEAE